MEGSDVDPSTGLLRWRHERSGTLSVKSAYSALENNEVERDGVWQRIWKLDTVQRCRSFMWLAVQNKLLTNEERHRRGMCLDATCTWCQQSEETLVHVLRDCPETQKFGCTLIPRSMQQEFFAMNLQQWLRTNIGRRCERLRPGWSASFATACWLLWKRRNTRIFENQIQPNELIQAQLQANISCISKAKKAMNGVNLNGLRVIDRSRAWEYPPAGWLKLNIDGAFTVQRGIGCGGVLRNETGKLVQAFMFHIQGDNCFSAELWSLLLGLKMTWELGVRKMIVETDSLAVVQVLQDPNVNFHVDRDLISQAKDWLARNWEVDVRHIPRESNKVADALAGNALSGLHGYQQFSEVQGEIMQLVEAECRSGHDAG